MPRVLHPADEWFPRRLGASMTDVNTLKKQSTEYVVNENRECVAIIGNLENAPTYDPATNLTGTEVTGLTGWGIATFNNGVWSRVEGAVLPSRGWRSTAFTQKAVTLERIPLNAASYDPGGNLDLVNGYYVVPDDGYYIVQGAVAWASAGSEPVARIASIFVNGVERSRPSRSEDSSEADLMVGDILSLSAGDQVELFGYCTLALGLQVAESVNYLAVAKV